MAAMRLLHSLLAVLRRMRMKNCPSSSYSVLGSVMKAQTVSAVGVLLMGIVLMSVSLNIDFVVFTIVCGLL